MGIDHTTSGSDDPSENAERTPAPDRPPPPPPDNPGSQGYPSRAASRAGAAAANTTDQPTGSAYEKVAASDAATQSPSDEQPDAEKSSSGEEAKAENEAGLPETQSRRATVSDTASPPETEPSLSRPETRDTARDVPVGVRPASAPEEVHTTPERPADAPVPTADRTAPAERTKTTDQATSPELAAESIPDTGDRPLNGLAKPRPDSLGAAPEPDADIERAIGAAQDRSAITEADGSESETSAESSHQPVGSWKHDIRVEYLPLEDHLDRTAGDYRPADERHTPLDVPPDEGPTWVEKRSDLPSGEDLLDERDETTPRPEKLRRKFFEVVDDVHDVTAKAASRGHDIFAHPPTGHAEVSASPEVVPAPNEAVNSGDLATGLLVLGIMLGEGLRHLRKSKRRERK